MELHFENYPSKSQTMLAIMFRQRDAQHNSVKLKSRPKGVISPGSTNSQIPKFVPNDLNIKFTPLNISNRTAVESSTLLPVTDSNLRGYNNVATHSSNGRYYVYDGENYTKTFPIEWAINSIPGTGPKDCHLCREHGSWNGAFVGYCHKCAYVYNNCRGYGFWGIHNGESVYPDNPGSATSTYMCDVKLRDIGDKNIMDSESLFLDYSIITSEITLNDIAEKNKRWFDRMITDFENLLAIRKCFRN